MNTRAIAEEYRLQHWAQIIQKCKESGLSIKAFCESAGFHPNIYYYWQRKLREAACQEMDAKQQKGTTAAKQLPAPSGWAVCEVAKPEPGGSQIVVEIGRCRITAAANVDQELLAKVCRVLVAL